MWSVLGGKVVVAVNFPLNPESIEGLGSEIMAVGLFLSSKGN
jgi:hypothetical protein